MIAAERLEHNRRLVPLLRGDEQRGRVVLRGGTDRRCGRDARDAEELADGTGDVARRLFRLSLPVDRCRQALGDLGTQGVLRRQPRREFAVGTLRLDVACRIEVRVREHGPRHQLLAGIGARAKRQQPLGDGLGPLAVARVEQRLGRAGEHARHFGLIGERVGEPQRGIDRAQPQCGSLCLGHLRLSLVISHQGCITGTTRSRIRSVRIGSPLVLGCGGLEVRTFEQQVGEQQSRRRRLRCIVEAVEVVTIPAHGGIAIRGRTALLCE